MTLIDGDGTEYAVTGHYDDGRSRSGAFQGGAELVSAAGRTMTLRFPVPGETAFAEVVVQNFSFDSAGSGVTGEFIGAGPAAE